MDRQNHCNGEYKESIIMVCATHAIEQIQAIQSRGWNYHDFMVIPMCRSNGCPFQEYPLKRDQNSFQNSLKLVRWCRISLKMNWLLMFPSKSSLNWRHLLSSRVHLIIPSVSPIQDNYRAIVHMYNYQSVRLRSVTWFETDTSSRTVISW